MSSKEEKHAKKQLDLKVLTMMLEYGILNHLHSKMITNVAQLVSDIDCQPMKPYKTVKHGENDTVAAEFVFDYLRKHQMWDTIRCIETETNGELSQAVLKKPTGIISREFKITEKEGLLATFTSQWLQMLQDTQIVAENAEHLKQGIAARLEGLQSRKHSRKTQESKKQPDTTSKAATTKAIPPQLPKKPSAVQPEELSDLDDVDSDAKPAPDPKAQTQVQIRDTNKMPSRIPPKTSPLVTKNDSSELNGSSFQDVDDEPETFRDKRSFQPIPKPSANTVQPRKRTQSESSDLQDLDDMLDDMKATPPKNAQKPGAKKQQGSARRSRGSDLDYEDLTLTDDELSPKPQNPANKKRMQVGLASEDDDISLGLSSDESPPPKRQGNRPSVNTAPIRNATDTDSDINLDLNDW